MVKIPRARSGDRNVDQLQENIAQAIEPMFANVRRTFTASLTGCTAQASVTATWETGVQGGPVTVSIPDLIGTSNTNACTITGLPAAVWPKSEQTVLIRVTDNGVVATGYAVIDTSGTITLWASVSGSTFTALGQKGLSASNFTYVRGI